MKWHNQNTLVMSYLNLAEEETPHTNPLQLLQYIQNKQLDFPACFARVLLVYSPYSCAYLFQLSMIQFIRLFYSTSHIIQHAYVVRL